MYECSGGACPKNDKSKKCCFSCNKQKDCVDECGNEFQECKYKVLIREENEI